MKKILQITINLAAFCVVCSCALVCSAQAGKAVGGYREVSKTDKEVVAAADFAVKTQSEKDTPFELVSIERAEKQIVSGSNYQLCLAVNAQNGQQQASAVVYQNLQNEFSLTSWKFEKCSTPESVTAKPISEKDLAGVWDAGGDLNKFVVKGKIVQRVLTELAESTVKNFEINVGDIDFVGVMQGNVIKGTQTFYLDSESRSHCPGLSSTKIKAEFSLSADGKTFNVVRDDPYFDWDTCQWTVEGRKPVVEQMTRK